MKIFSLLDESPVIIDYEVLDFKKWKTGFYYKIQANLLNNELLFLREYSDESGRQYSYHWQDKDQNIIIRWDNAPHHKDLKSFPHHKHIGYTIDESNEITVEEIIIFIEKTKDL